VKYTARIGTPSHMIENTYSAPSLAKNAAAKQVKKHRHWARRYNLALADRCDAALTEIDTLGLETVPLGEPRRWTLRDDYTGFTLVVELERNWS
jgi:hypothetical protein